MKHAAFALSLVLTAGLVSTAAFVGCGGGDDDGNTTAADTGVDSTPVDTGKIDTGAPETPVFTTCPDPLPTGYTCSDEAPVKKGATVCTEQALQELSDACFSSGGDCAKWQKTYAECNKCALGTWLVSTEGGNGFLDVGACMQAIDPASPCGKSERCWFECRELSCESCETADRNKCITKVRRSTDPKGACYDIAYKPAKACEDDPKFASCSDLVEFYRGACMYNGDFSKAAIPGPIGTDAGTETGTETGVDTGVTDTGTADTGTADTGLIDTGSLIDSAVLDALAD